MIVFHEKEGRRQHAKRTGRDACDLKGMIQECWAGSDSHAAFAHALKERGLVLARGDRRGHVAVTHDGEVLSVARYAGRKAKEVRAKLGQPDDLPTIDEAMRQMAAEVLPAMKRLLSAQRETLVRELEHLEAERRELTRQHREERRRLDVVQAERRAREARARPHRFNTGLRGLWDRLRGHEDRIRRHNKAEAYAALQRDWAQRQALQARIRDLRTHPAADTRDLHRDRLHYRRQAQISTPSREPHARPAPLRETFARAAGPMRERAQCPDTAERLRHLRTGASTRTATRDRDPGPER